MARIMELFVIANAVCGIAAFLGVRMVVRRSRDAANEASTSYAARTRKSLRPIDIQRVAFAELEGDPSFVLPPCRPSADDGGDVVRVLNE